jgi:hypothetical protein
LSSADWTSFNGRVPSTRTLTINGTTQDLSADRTFTVSADNIYTANGTLTADRTVTNSTFLLQFKGGQEILANEQTALRLETSTTGKQLLFSLNNLSGKNWLIRSLADGQLDFRNITNTTTNLSLDGASADVTLYRNLKSSLNHFFLGQGTFHRSLTLGKTSVTAANYSIAENGAETLINADTGGLLRFRIANADKMMLTNAGRLLLGTTTESTFLLDVNGTARVSGTLTFANTTANVINVIDYGNGSGFASSGIKLLNQTGFYSGFTYLSSTGVSYLTYRQLYFAGNQTEATATTANSHAYFTLSGIFTTNNEINAVGGITSSLYKFPSGNNVASGIIQWPNVGFKTGFKLLNATTALAAGFIYDGTSGPSYLFGRGGQNFLVGIGVDDTNMTISNATFYIDATNKFIINKQTSINDASPSLSAIFNISSTTQGFLPPRMTSTQRNAIGSPAQGLMLFDTTLNKLCVYSGTSWETITSV